MIKSELLTTKRTDILKIAAEHGGRHVRIFGSFAQGKASPESDIDILVDMEPGRSLVDIIAIKHEVEDLTHREVDVVTEAALSPYLRDKILREAVEL